jgi:hypothetical protein
MAEGCLENFSRRNRWQRFEMHPIAEVLDAGEQPVHGVMPPPFVTIVRSQFAVWLIAGEPMKDT